MRFGTMVFAVVLLLWIGVMASLLLRGTGIGASRFNLEIRGDTMTPHEFEVEKGDRVSFRITVDHPIVLRVRSVITREIEPVDGPSDAIIGFRAERAGRFGIEDVREATKLGTLIVREQP